MRWRGSTGALLLVALRLEPAAADGWRDHLTLVASDRARGEFVSWFEPPPGTAPAGAERYNFFGNQLRLGARVTFPHLQMFVEMQDTRLANLPDDASLAPPQGNLGTGANYFANTHDTSQGEPFLKQGFLTLRQRGLSATMGRFDYRDGLETVPGDATLATVKRTRIAERLIGPFDFTHVTRSFDGGRVAYDRPDWNATALAFFPTQGGFEVSANRAINEIWLTGLALTAKRLPGGAPPADVRAFWLYYQDDRGDVLKVDNRPEPVRRMDHDAIAVHTWGGHAITAFEAGPGIVDLLFWTALQWGHWGDQDDAAWAWALEGGYQLPRLPASPWLRIGWDRSSGDDDPSDDDHRTFFQLLPTPRIYAQLPFYNLMNSSDVFAELVLQPHARVTLRTDYHWLQVTESRDLWYQGGGATNRDLFGYAGSPANGERGLAQLVDLSVTVQVLEQLTLGAYYGHAFGGSVVGQSFAGRDTDYGFVEATWRFQR